MQDQDLPRLRILAVEDSEMSRLVVVRYCNKLGFNDVVAVATGEQALEYLASTPCDLVLMDLEMPRMDGCETTLRIRRGDAGEQSRMVPVIAMSSHVQSAIMQRCRDVGMNGYLPKPLYLENMQEILKAHFTLHGINRQNDLDSCDSSHGAFSNCGSHGKLLDKPLAVERMGGDQEIYDELKHIFLNEYADILSELQQARSEHDVETLRQRAHNLKNLYKTVGAESCGNICKAMEKAVKEHEPEKAWSLLPLLLQETSQLVALLRD